MKHKGVVVVAQFSPDGQRVVTASGEYAARLWEVATGQTFGEPMRHEGWVVSAQFSPDGRRVLTASWDHTARLWDANTGQALGQACRDQSPMERLCNKDEAVLLRTRVFGGYI
jgi:WD40 repeat protein